MKDQNIPPGAEANPQTNQSSSTRKNSRAGSLFRVIAALLLLGALAFGGWYMMQQAAFDRQQASEKILKECGVIAIKDSSRKKILTVTVPPQLGADKLPSVFESIGGLAWVNSLSVMGPNVTDDLASHLAKCGSLRSLKMANTQLTDKGVSHLADLPNVESLILRGSPITKDCLPGISGMSSVKVLDLSETKIDGGLADLSKLSNLEWLLLNEVEIKDESFASIADCSKLSRLSIIKSVIDENSITDLKEKRPDINVEQIGATE